MSCMLLDDDVLSRITHSVYYVTEQPHFVSDFIERCGISETQQGRLEKILGSQELFILELYRVNQLAYCQRYDELVELRYPALSLPIIQGRRLDMLQDLKYMQCWIYQVNDRKTARHEVIYKLIEYTIRELGLIILRRIPEYDDLKWAVI